MGFYGKVEHTDKLNFVIDRIYPNRKKMESSANEDGIFAGRYVLVDYEQEATNPYIRHYTDADSMDFYFDINLSAETRAKYTADRAVTDGDYYIELNEIIYILDESNVKQFYKCTGKTDVGDYAVFAKAYAPDTSGTYHNNYSIDIEKYGESRGYDSTVWQKVYVDEKEKYVMIAELNSVVPTFDITVDPPTLNPIPPHFDADSNNVYYKLHMQPNWGFKVREAAENEESDVTITARLAEWDDINKTLNNKYKNYSGAIYFNRDGFDPDYHYNKNDNEVPIEDNKIEITRESSGKKDYNTAHGNYETQLVKDKKTGKWENLPVDTQALEIMLPGIGRALSELWDLAYGTGEYIDGDNEKKARNKEIKWDTVTGLRLVKTSQNPDNSGFEYDTVGIDTIAGCINSVHDLIGMIIVNDAGKELTLDDALVNRIYYRDGQYWIKDLTYNYVDVSNEDQIIQLKQFGDNYYYKNGDNYYKELEGYQAGNKYYEFDENAVSPIKLCQEVWKPHTYYYQEGENFELDGNSLPDEDKTYYKISEDLEEIEVVVTNKLTGLCFFPTSYTTTTYNTLFPTIKATATKPGKGLFYIGQDENGQTGYLLYEQGKNIPYKSQLYYWDGYELEVSTTTDGKFIETYEFSRATQTVVNTVPFTANTFYYQDADTKDWVLLESEEEIDLTKQYYQFGETGVEKTVIDGRFYEPNLYYYLDYVDYILDTDADREPGIQYYVINKDLITGVSEETVFYEPGKYYYKDGDEYILDTAEKMDEKKVYYKNIYTRYIHPDSTNKNFLPGAVWNEEIKTIPEGVKLALREEKYQWKPLNGFARSLNTINGLILKINNIMKFDDILTRDNKTVQGCINQMNDIINAIDKLKPNHFIAVNENGKMTSMAPKTDAWINVEINPNNSNKIIIAHEFNAVEDTSTESNVNDQGDTITLYTPKVDEKGHIVGKTINTVTLPFSYKTFQDSEETPGKTVAANTQDVLILRGDNWIKPTISQGKIEYSHIGPVATNETPKTNLTPAFGDTFEIEDWQFDEKGHKSNKTTHTVKIPQGKLIDNTKNGSDVITQLEFTPSTGEIKTTRNNIATLTLESYAKGTSNDDIVATDTLGVALSKLQTQMHDEESARASVIQSTTTDLNKKINDEIEARNTAISQEVADRNTAIKVETDARIAAINALDATITTESSELITSITQTDGLVSAGKKKVGDLTLGGWALGQSTVNNESIADTDTINNAFAKAQRQINANKLALSTLNGNSTTPGSVAYQIAQIVNENNNGSIDTLNEIAAWIVNDETGVAKMNKDISDLKTDVSGLEEQVQTATTGLLDRTTSLETLVGEKAVSAQINEALFINDEAIYALASDLSNSNQRIEELENNVDTWNAAEANVQSDWNESDTTSDAYILNKPDLTNIVETTSQFDYTVGDTTNQLTIAQLVAKVAELEATIQTLTAST